MFPLSSYFVDQGCIPPLCDLLTVMDAKIIRVALNGIENILKIGENDSKIDGNPNKYALIIEENFGNVFFFFNNPFLLYIPLRKF